MLKEWFGEEKGFHTMYCHQRVFGPSRPLKIGNSVPDINESSSDLKFSSSYLTLVEKRIWGAQSLFTACQLRI